MTDTERAMLKQIIAERGLTDGNAIKHSGAWYVNGVMVIAPKPIIKLPHWIEGGLFETIIIEQRR